MAETNISDPQPTELPQEDCRTFHGDLDWYHFLLTSIGTWLGAALIVLIPRLIYAPLKVTSVNKISYINFQPFNANHLNLSTKLLHLIYSRDKKRMQLTINYCLSLLYTITSKHGQGR